jgi:molybdopterin/thiamine biosynthesis adenylyltransferase
MLTTDPALVLVTHTVADTITASTATWGIVRFARDEPDVILAAVGCSEKSGPMFVTSRDVLRGHSASQADGQTEGPWYRAPENLHEHHRWLLRVGAGVALDDFRSLFPTWRTTGKDSAVIVLTYDPVATRRWAAWMVTAAGVAPLEATVLRADDADPIQLLADDWPIDELAQSRFTIVGVGSIGSAIAHALAMAGVGHLTLVDDDRLLWHNLVRHQCSRRDVGRYKVDAAADAITARWPGTAVDPTRLNVITNADRMRPLFDTSDIVICAADGVSPRRVVSHLARRSNRPAILACVLLDGAVGEVVRLRPWPGHGCLLCQRQKLIDDGVLDPEPYLDRPYGTGDRHLPMTAVGTDLVLVGQLATKVALATVLETRGHHDQTIRGEYAMIGLRPDGNTAEVGPPFDLECGEVRWLPAHPPTADCPTCSV